MTVFDDDTLQARLADLPTWSGDSTAISRSVDAPDFPTAIAIVTDVAEAAERVNHHPDIDIRYKTLRFALATHSAGGVTEADIRLARVIDEIAQRHSPG